MNAYLRGLACYLPPTIRDNDELVRMNPTWSADSIFRKVGIRKRHVASPNETAADLGFLAAERLFEELRLDRQAVDALIFCTQSPDYVLPASACILQSRLGLPTNCGAFDFNQGCSGFTYGLWIARSLVISKSARNVLLIVADTYSRYCNPHDLTTATIFGDAGAAAVISADSSGAWAEVGESVVGTDGRGASNLIVRCGAAREPKTNAGAEVRNHPSGAVCSDEQLYMNGPEIFSFTIGGVQPALEQLATKVGLAWNDIDWFLLHQANRFMLNHLRNQMQLPPEKMPIELENTGNTVSASIPLLISLCKEKGLFQPGQQCLLAGFGVGYSWAMTHLKWILP